MCRAVYLIVPSIVNHNHGMAGRVVAHIDMNAFFASVAQAAAPHLSGKPVLVAGGPGDRGVVLTASYEARPSGARSGMALRTARRLCPEAIVVPPDRAAYSSASRSIERICLTVTDRVEMASNDEAFLDLTPGPREFDRAGQETRPYETAESTVRRVQARIVAELHLPSSAGISFTKTLAKLGSDLAPKGGLTLIRPDNLPAILQKADIEDLVGIGPVTAKTLRRRGINTLSQLAALSEPAARDLGGAHLVWLREACHGADDGPVRRPDEEAPAKSVGRTETLPRDTDDRAVLRAYLRLLAEDVAEDLRAQKRVAGGVALILRYADFRTLTRQARLGEPTDDGAALAARAARLLDALYPLRLPARLVGVRADSLSASASAQPGLFDTRHGGQARARRAAVDQAVDALNTAFGRGALRPASALLIEKFEHPSSKKT